MRSRSIRTGSSSPGGARSVTGRGGRAGFRHQASTTARQNATSDSRRRSDRGEGRATSSRSLISVLSRSTCSRMMSTSIVRSRSPAASEGEGRRGRLHGRQRVADLVGDAHEQVARGGPALVGRHAARHLPLLGHVAQDHHPLAEEGRGPVDLQQVGLVDRARVGLLQLASSPAAVRGSGPAQPFLAEGKEAGEGSPISSRSGRPIRRARDLFNRRMHPSWSRMATSSGIASNVISRASLAFSSRSVMFVPSRAAEMPWPTDSHSETTAGGNAAGWRLSRLSTPTVSPPARRGSASAERGRASRRSASWPRSGTLRGSPVRATWPTTPWLSTGTASAGYPCQSAGSRRRLDGSSRKIAQWSTPATANSARRAASQTSAACRPVSVAMPPEPTRDDARADSRDVPRVPSGSGSRACEG